MPDDRFFPHVSLLPQVVHAGFPSPGDDYAEPSLNLHDLVVPHPNSTYFIKVSGNSMNGACIRAGDIVVVDRALTAAHNKIVVARVSEHLLLKRVQVRQRKVFLHSDPPEFPAIELGQQDEIWGSSHIAFIACDEAKGLYAGGRGAVLCLVRTGISSSTARQAHDRAF